jgi:hypothetical protein
MFKYVWDKWQDASASFNDRSKKYHEKFVEITSAIPNDKWQERFYSEALKDTIDRSQLIAFVLNVGNPSNYHKLQEGLGLTDQQMQEMIELVSDDEWVVVQQVWDLVNSLYDEMAENHFDITGVRPEKIEARKFVTPTGRVMEGGYYPVKYNRKLDSTISRLAAMSDAEGMFQQYYGAPDMSPSYAEGRNDKFSAPILLDLDVAATHIGQVLYDLSWRKTLRDSWKIFHHPLLADVIKTEFGEAYLNAIEHRIKKLAHAPQEADPNLRQLTNDLRRIRTNTTVYALGSAFTTTVVQPAGIVAAIPRVFADGNMHKGAALLGKSLRLVTNPRTWTETREFIHKSSGEMRHRSDTMDNNINRATKDLKGENTLSAKVKQMAFVTIAWSDYITSGTVWMARYNASLVEHDGDHDAAVRDADFAVLQTQGAGDVKDLAQVQDSSEFLKTTTMFYSYFSALYQEQRRIGTDYLLGEISLPKALGQFLAIVILPQIVADLLTLRIPFGEEDEDEQGLLGYAATKVLLSPFMSVIWVRDLASLVEARVRGINADYAISPIAGVVDQTVRFLETLVDLMQGEAEPIEVVAEAIPAGGMLKGYPLRQVETVTDNWITVSKEGAEFEFLDLLRRRRKGK